MYRRRRRFQIEGLSDLRSPSSVGQDPLYGTVTCEKNRSLLEETEFFKCKKKRGIRTSGVWKLVSRLESNFQKREGPAILTGLFKTNPVLRNIKAGERPQNTKERKGKIGPKHSKRDFLIESCKIEGPTMWNICTVQPEATTGFTEHKDVFQVIG
jgi:hypothetical protein